MGDLIGRVGLAVVVAGVLGFGLLHARWVPRDLALTAYALVVAVLGIFAVFGPQAAAIGAAIVVLVFVVGASIYGALALVAHWADGRH